ncbi:hypothetical protein F5Y07DRAFT_151201 [Xylaria sp. FL0933]|nr:hypothetical protein F5Y07DRAFT_151201 [Xylaria sp. FL0933]
METGYHVRSIARVVLLMIFNLILDLCFLAAVHAKASQEPKPSYHAALLMGVSSLRTLATITPLFPPRRSSLTTPQQECDSIKPIPDLTMTLKSSGTSWPRSPATQHTILPGDCKFEEATRLVRGGEDEEEASDVGLANLIRMREKQAYQLRGLAPLERFIVARDNIPVGLDDQD